MGLANKSVVLYAINVLHLKGIVRVDPLLTEEFLSGYVRWMHETRGRPRASIRPLISGLHIILLHHPRFNRQKIEWWPNVLGQIDKEPKSIAEERREQRTLPYEQLLKMLERMRSARETATGISGKTLAWMVHDELLMMFSVRLVWDPTLIRTCRITGSSPHVFKKEVPTNRPDFSLTPAARKALKKDLKALFWQFDFERERGAGAFGLIMDAVVSLLGDFVQRYRKELLQGAADPGTLFFNRRLRPLSKHNLTYTIGRLTYEFANKKRLTADCMRISFIDYWLTENPGDFLNLANILMVTVDAILQRFDPDYASSFKRKR
jgi:hypothetical protein